MDVYFYYVIAFSVIMLISFCFGLYKRQKMHKLIASHQAYLDNQTQAFVNASIRQDQMANRAARHSRSHPTSTSPSTPTVYFVAVPVPFPMDPEEYDLPPSYEQAVGTQTR